MKIQCLETQEIFNDIYSAANKYNIALYTLNKALVHGYFAGEYNGKKLHWREYSDITLDTDIYYKLYVIEQNIKDINIYINKNKIQIQCIKTQEVFTDIKIAAQKYNTTNILIYSAIKYGYTAGIDENNNKLHWININYPIYQAYTDRNDNWIPICIICDISQISNDKLLNKLKNDINCHIYNLLNQYPLNNFRVARINKYQYILNNIIKKNKKQYKIQIQCIETNEIFDSINKAVKKYHINPYTIKMCIKNNLPTSKDNEGNLLHWKFIEQNNSLNIYKYFTDKFKNINVNDIFEQANTNLSQYYNLYNKHLTSQSLISNKIFKNIDIIYWNLIKNNPYLNTNELCKNITDNIVFLNYQSAAQYYNKFLKDIKNIINNNDEFIHNKTKQKIININKNELKDNTIIYAISYQIIKIIINNTIIYTITYNSFNKFKAQLESDTRSNFGIGILIKNCTDYQCNVIKSHIYFKEEADIIKCQLSGYKENIFRCKLPVKCITTGEIFNSIYDACQKYGYKSETNILYVCREQREYTIDKQTGQKLQWQFLEKKDNYIPINKNQNKYTVFLLYYNNDLILISKSILFNNKQLSSNNKHLILNKLKTNYSKFKIFCNNINTKELKFIIHTDNLSFNDAQKLIKNLKSEYIKNNVSILIM